MNEEANLEKNQLIQSFKDKKSVSFKSALASRDGPHSACLSVISVPSVVQRISCFFIYKLIPYRHASLRRGFHGNPSCGADL